MHTPFEFECENKWVEMDRETNTHIYLQSTFLIQKKMHSNLAFIFYPLNTKLHSIHLYFTSVMMEIFKQKKNTVTNVHMPITQFKSINLLPFFIYAHYFYIKLK